MRLTKERKIYLAVFGLGFAALVADRLFVTPTGASAATSDAVPEAAAPAVSPPPSAEPAREGHHGPSFAERLAKHAQWSGQTPRDAFLAPREWVAQPVVQASEPPPADSDVFIQQHRLSVVFRSAKGVMAIVGGKTIMEGEVLDGYKLVDVEDTKEVRAAIFERDGVRLRLPVSDRTNSRKPDKTGQ